MAPEEDPIPLQAVVVPVPLWMFEGRQAYELRQMGLRVPENIPDIAFVQDGSFRWVTVDFVVQAPAPGFKREVSEEVPPTEMDAANPRS